MSDRRTSLRLIKEGSITISDFSMDDINFDIIDKINDVEDIRTNRRMGNLTD